MPDPSESPLIRGEKVWLRGYTEADLGPYESFVNSRAAGLAGYTLPWPDGSIRDWYRNKVVAEHGKSADHFAVSPLGSDEFIGTTWVWNQGSRIGGSEFSIFMADPAKWGTGLGTDAGRVTTDFVFGYTDIERLWLASEEDNHRAHRSFEKVGFTKEGLIRGYARFRGDSTNAVLMSMLREDWQKLDRPRSWDYD